MTEVAVRIELFEKDPDAFLDFYTRVLRFSVVRNERNSDSYYISVRRGPIRIAGAMPFGEMDIKHRSVPTGAEIVIEVADLEEEYRHIQHSGWKIESELQRRPWGLMDFRVHDPDGYYIRFTTMEGAEDK